MNGQERHDRTWRPSTGRGLHVRTWRASRLNVSFWAGPGKLYEMRGYFCVPVTELILMLGGFQNLRRREINGKIPRIFREKLAQNVSFPTTSSLAKKFYFYVCPEAKNARMALILTGALPDYLTPAISIA
ncbi:unnamed protein product [Nesidiocoris tenuis]|uniref:Uncharacterized protein n=1 Tax=Nesidiocoris tenuis TaxID=355587 RepID=A0A6H5GF62_9HEMI|nr:unnamed protein product [Nesidiocoris tenuis]